jgi:type II secretory pathway component PulF
MPNYRYKAVDSTGRVVKGTTIALDEAQVEKNLIGAGLDLIHCTALRQNAGTRILQRGIKPRTLVEFYHRFSQTLEVGLPVLSALDENARYLPSPTMRKISGEMKAAIEGGRTLYEAMQRYPRYFQKLDLALIRIGEQTGGMAKSLKNLAAFLEWKEDIRSTIRKAAIYPTFVVLAIVCVIAVWIGYVLPQMVSVLSEMEVTIPAVTAIVLRISQFVKAQWIWLCVAAVVPVGILLGGLKTRRGALLIHEWVLKIPLVGTIVQNVAMARLCHNFATMLASGISIQYIFETLSTNALGNRYLEDRLRRAFRAIEGGDSIAGGFETAGGFPSLLLGAIRNGEETGTLDDTFQRLGDYFDGEVKRTVQSMVSAIEPLTLVALGGVFGLIVLSVLLPLYDVMAGLGNAY